MILADYLEKKRAAFDKLLDQTLPPPEEHPAVLHQAMRYTLFNGGKRLRPILCLAACEAAGAPGHLANTPALAIECLHTYTLIHDDLPAMDNDELRRGRPTAHIVFGEAHAILAGDALLTFAFEILARQPAPAEPLAWIRELASAAGSRGVVGGQVDDIAAELDARIDASRLDLIHQRKTAALIVAACRMGGQAANADEDLLQRLGHYGRCIGIAFQIVDDILDVTGQEQQLGKPVGSDRKNSKTTSVTLHGLEGARQRARELVAEATDHLEPFSAAADPLRALAQFIIERDQ